MALVNQLQVTAERCCHIIVVGHKLSRPKEVGEYERSTSKNILETGYRKYMQIEEILAKSKYVCAANTHNTSKPRNTLQVVHLLGH